MVVVASWKIINKQQEIEYLLWLQEIYDQIDKDQLLEALSGEQNDSLRHEKIQGLRDDVVAFEDIVESDALRKHIDQMEINLSLIAGDMTGARDAREQQDDLYRFVQWTTKVLEAYELLEDTEGVELSGAWALLDDASEYLMLSSRLDTKATYIQENIQTTQDLRWVVALGILTRQVIWISRDIKSVQAALETFFLDMSIWDWILQTG